MSVAVIFLHVIITITRTLATTSSSSPAGALIHNDIIIRQLIAQIHSSALFCANSSAPSWSGQLSPRQSPTTDAALHSLIRSVFSEHRLHENYRCEVKHAVQFTSLLYRLEPSGKDPAHYLKAYLHSQKSVNVSHSNATTPWHLTLLGTSSALFGLGTCLSGKSTGYANVLETSPTEVTEGGVSLLHQLCTRWSQNNVTRLGQASPSLFETTLGNFSLVWLANQCQPLVVGQPPVVRLIISSADATNSVFFEFDIRNFTLNQCDLLIHRCGFTTECKYRRYNEWPLSMDNYFCKCLKSFYRNNSENGYPATSANAHLEMAHLGLDAPSSFATTNLPTRRFQCHPCPLGCEPCSSAAACLMVYENSWLRAVPLAFQSFCITVCLLLGIAVFRLRRTKVVKASNWLLLEILLIGAILLYLIVVVMYFPSSDVTCQVLPWLRELGFSIMYGVLIVKIYRVLSCFLSRKAHRVHVRDKDILKYLGLFVGITFAYMVAWTAVNLDYISSSPWSDRKELGEDPVPVSMVERGHVMASLDPTTTTTTAGGNNESLANLTTGNSGWSTRLEFNRCRLRFWDFVVELMELIILAVSIHYCRLVRTAPSDYNENLYISAALYLELVVSTVFTIVRHVIWSTVHPDYIYLLYFARSHVTITANLILIFSPKVYHLFRPVAANVSGVGSRNRGNAALPYSADPNPSKLTLTLNGDLDIGDVNLADMDPEVIRRELKRLYTQIELYRTKAMRKENPHISRRRGGRKQRRFSLQPFHKRHHGTSTNPSGVPLRMHSEEECCWARLKSTSGMEHQHGCQQGKSLGPSCPHQLPTRAPEAPQPDGGEGSGSSRTVTTSPGAVTDSLSQTCHSLVMPNDEEVSRVSEESTNSLGEDMYPLATAASTAGGSRSANSVTFGGSGSQQKQQKRF